MGGIVREGKREVKILEKMKSSATPLPETVLKIKQVFQALCYESSLDIHVPCSSK